jgi:hypothetical protein
MAAAASDVPLRRKTMKRAELQREILVSYLSDLADAREQLHRAEKGARRYLKTHKQLKAAYDEFMRYGGGSLEELQHWLATTRPLPTLAQKKHMRPTTG